MQSSLNRDKRGSFNVLDYADNSVDLLRQNKAQVDRSRDKSSASLSSDDFEREDAMRRMTLNADNSDPL